MLAWISSTLGRMICSANEACSVMCCLLLVPPLAPEEAVLGRRPALLLLGALVALVVTDHAPAGADVFPTVVRHPGPPPPSHGISLIAPKSRPLRCSFRLLRLTPGHPPFAHTPPPAPGSRAPGADTT